MNILVLKQLKKENETMKTKQQIIDFIYKYACPEYKGMLNNKPSYLILAPNQATTIAVLEDLPQDKLMEIYKSAENRKKKFMLK